jgi:hypothetical protein
VQGVAAAWAIADCMTRRRGGGGGGGWWRAGGYGAITPEVRDRASECRAALVALVRAGAALPLEVAAWPDRWRDAAEERAGIIEFEGGRPRAAAEVEAERLVRVEHARAFVDRSALVVTPAAVAVAPRAPGTGPHRHP